jgi:hypothetical protein
MGTRTTVCRLLQYENENCKARYGTVCKVAYLQYLVSGLISGDPREGVPKSVLTRLISFAVNTVHCVRTAVVL